MRYQILGVLLIGALVTTACTRAPDQTAASSPTPEASSAAAPAPTPAAVETSGAVVASTETTSAAMPPLVSPRNSEGSGRLVLEPSAVNPIEMDAHLASRITAIDLKAKIDAGQAILVDVRDDGSWKIGHAKGAVHIPIGQIVERAGSLPADKWIVTYCT